MKQYATSLIVVLICFVLQTPHVHAADFFLKCDDKKCTPSSITSFFDQKVLWYPTYSESNTVTIKNEGNSDQYIGHRAYNIQNTHGTDISPVLDLVIIRKSTDKVVWKSTLQEFYNTTEAVLGVLGSGKTDSFEYIITMNKDAGNEYQGGSTQFDMLFGYFIPTVTPTPTNTPTPINTPTPSPLPPPVAQGQGSTPNSIEKGEVQGAMDHISIPKPIKQIILYGQKRFFSMRYVPTDSGAPVHGAQSSAPPTRIPLLVLLVMPLGTLVFLITMGRKKK